VDGVRAFSGGGIGDVAAARADAVDDTGVPGLRIFLHVELSDDGGGPDGIGAGCGEGADIRIVYHGKWDDGELVALDRRRTSGANRR